MLHSAYCVTVSSLWPACFVNFLSPRLLLLFQNEWNSLWWASENCALLFSSSHIMLQRVYEVWLFNVATKGVLAMWTRVPSALTCVKPIIGCNMTCPREGLARNVFFSCTAVSAYQCVLPHEICHGIIVAWTGSYFIAIVLMHIPLLSVHCLKCGSAFSAS